MTPENRTSKTINISMEGLTLRVADVERSLAFYQMLPSVEVVVHRPGEFALLSIGKGMVGLLKYGATHVEFGTSDVDGLYRHLKDVGFPVEGEPSQKPWGEYTFTVHDPDGHVLEFDDSHGV
ncbi:MAG: VOC family protein [Ktedonobacteraceae bacterium]|nr:VOC family protein [Ktedonobacteraceae bacterium]